MKNSELDIIVKTIADGYKPEKIYLFGSSLNNSTEVGNDIDLLIIKSTEEPFLKRPLSVHRLFKPYIYNLDIRVYTPEEFDASKNSINTIAYIVNRRGRLLYDA